MVAWFVRRIKELDRRLLPDDPCIGWLPYLWLMYLLGYVVQIYYDPSPRQQWLSALAIPIFLVLYFRGYWLRGRKVLPIIAAISVLGIVFLPLQSTAIMFFIYAASFCGQMASTRQAVGVMLTVTGVSVIAALYQGIHPIFMAYTAMMTLLIGVINTYQAHVNRKNAQLRLSQDEVRQLAAMAERERISRDLHDLLGHTLSVITLKSELAGKLLSRGDARALEEISDVERISRETLQEVRDAVVGFREAGLRGELANARLAFDAMDIQFHYVLPDEQLASEQEAVLALVVREAITNVVRHSGADVCRISFTHTTDALRLLIQDNGRGGSIREGSGISGMRTRLAEVGASLAIETTDGLSLRIELPLGPQEPSKTPVSCSGENGLALGLERPT